MPETRFELDDSHAFMHWMIINVLNDDELMFVSLIFKLVVLMWTATPKLRERGSSRWTKRSTQWTLWLSVPSNVTLKYPSRASKFTLLKSNLCIWGPASQPDICTAFTGLSCMLRRTKSVGQQQQTLKQRRSCAEAAQLFMKKTASPFVFISSSRGMMSSHILKGLKSVPGSPV